MATNRNQGPDTDQTADQAAEEAAAAEAAAKAAAEEAAAAEAKAAEQAAAEAQATGSPTPDEFGRLRVRDRDTGHQLTIHAGELPHGNYTVLNQRASDRSGDPLPPKHATR